MECSRTKFLSNHLIAGTSYAVALSLPPVDEDGDYVIKITGYGYVGSGGTRYGWVNIGIDGVVQDYEILFGNQNLAGDIYYPIHIESQPIHLLKGQVPSIMTRYGTNAPQLWAGSWISLVKV